MKRRSVLMAIVMAGMIAGCATHPPVRVNGKLMDKPESVEGMVTTQWQQGTIASWRISTTERVLVCLDPGCKEPAPESLRQAIEKLGIRTAKDRQEAAYTLTIRGFVTKQVTGKDAKSHVIPVPAILLVGAGPTQDKTEAWIGRGGDVADLERKGLTTFGLLSRNVVIYDTLWRHTGQLTQTVSGGSAGAYAIGFLLAPVLNAIGTVKAANELKEGLSGVELTFLPVEGAFKTVRTVYGFAASTREESPEALITAALKEAIEGARSFVDNVQQEDEQASNSKQGA